MRLAKPRGSCTLALALGLLAAASPARGQADPFRVGTKVVFKDKPALKIGKESVDPGWGSCTYTIEQRRGDWLWLTSKNAGGWARPKDVIPRHQALDYFTREILEHPSEPDRLVKRGRFWLDEGQVKLAFLDLDEAIRLDPKRASSYCVRGDAWLSLHEIDKALIDLVKSSALDPLDAVPIMSRGAAWAGKKEYDYALAAFNEAVRLAPKFCHAHSNLGALLGGKKDYDEAIAHLDEAIRLNPRCSEAYSNRAYIWLNMAKESGSNNLTNFAPLVLLTSCRTPL